MSLDDYETGHFAVLVESEADWARWCARFPERASRATWMRTVDYVERVAGHENLWISQWCMPNDPYAREIRAALRARCPQIRNMGADR